MGTVIYYFLLATLFRLSTIQVVVGDCLDEFAKCHQYSVDEGGDFVRCNMCVCEDGEHRMTIMCYSPDF